MHELGDLTIGQAGRAAGVTRKAIRVYEDKGLLGQPDRTAAGYRLFTTADVDTLRFIRRARALGLGLDDVAEVLTERRAGGSPCSSVRARLTQRIDDIGRAIADLEALRETLRDTLGGCPPEPEPEPSRICPIIEKP